MVLVSSSVNYLNMSKAGVTEIEGSQSAIQIDEIRKALTELKVGLASKQLVKKIDMDMIEEFRVI